MLVGNDGSLGLHPSIPPGLGEKAILPRLALSFGEHCKDGEYDANFEIKAEFNRVSKKVI